MSNTATLSGFQRTLVKDLALLTAIGQLVFPDHVPKRITASSLHGSWVSVQYGKFNYCICNDRHGLSGNKVKWADFEATTCHFSIWSTIYSPEILPEHKVQAIEWLKSHGYGPPTTQELWDNYWSD